MSPLTHNLIDTAVLMANGGAYNPGITLRLDHKSMTTKVYNMELTRSMIRPSLLTAETARKLANKESGCSADFSIYLMLAWSNYTSDLDVMFPRGKARRTTKVLADIVGVPHTASWLRGFLCNSEVYFPYPDGNCMLADVSPAKQAYILKRLITSEGY